MVNGPPGIGAPRKKGNGGAGLVILGVGAAAAAAVGIFLATRQPPGPSKPASALTFSVVEQCTLVPTIDQIAGRLTAAGAGLPGETVSIRQNNIPVASAVTDSQGFYRHTLSPARARGIVVNARWLGNADFAASTSPSFTLVGCAGPLCRDVGDACTGVTECRLFGGTCVGTFDCGGIGCCCDLPGGAGPAEATLFEDISFSGRSMVVTPGASVSDLAPLRDTISSVRIRNGTLQLFELVGFQGQSTTISADVSDLRSLGWNDRANSAIMTARLASGATSRQAAAARAGSRAAGPQHVGIGFVPTPGVSGHVIVK